MARFIFIGGVEGAGTTLLLRLLSAPPTCASLGGNYVKVPDAPAVAAAVHAFDQTNRRVWNRRASFAEAAAARQDWQFARRQLEAVPELSNFSHFLFKRSSPFIKPHGQYRPDLWDAVDVLDARIVLIFREPCATVYSAYRRAFDTDLRRLAVMCSEQLSWLSAQVNAIGSDRVRLVSYERLQTDPVGVLTGVASALDLPTEPVIAAAEAESWDTSTNERYQAELKPRMRNWLESYFDDRRRREWPLFREFLSR